MAAIGDELQIAGLDSHVDGQPIRRFDVTSEFASCYAAFRRAATVDHVGIALRPSCSFCTDPEVAEIPDIPEFGTHPARLPYWEMSIRDQTRGS
jgi:hypothetical protein